MAVVGSSKFEMTESTCSGAMTMPSLAAVMPQTLRNVSIQGSGFLSSLIFLERSNVRSHDQHNDAPHEQWSVSELIYQQMKVV